MKAATLSSTWPCYFAPPSPGGHSFGYGEVQFPHGGFGEGGVGAGVGRGEGLPPKNPKNACHHWRYAGIGGDGAGGGWILTGAACTETVSPGTGAWTTGAAEAGRVVLATAGLMAFVGATPATGWATAAAAGGAAGGGAS
jgi:hypothetical protein